VDELLIRIPHHFKHEEKMLKEIRFPPIRAHCLSHSRLLERADKLAAQLRDRQTTSGTVLGFVVHDVVARHIVLEDREFFPWMQRHKADNGRAVPSRFRRKTP